MLTSWAKESSVHLWTYHMSVGETAHYNGPSILNASVSSTQNTPLDSEAVLRA